MTDELRTWLNERETIHGEATEHLYFQHWGEQNQNGDYGESILFDERDGEELARGLLDVDGEAFVDAHNTLPKLVRGVRAVLELHKPIESIDGDDLCSTCAEEGDCTVAMHWPCPTVQALQEAINDD